MTHVLSLDCGITMTKAVILSVDGEEKGIGSCKSPVVYPKPGWVEKDLEEFWGCAFTAIRDALADSGVDPKDIACVAITAHGNGVVCLDDNFEPTRNGIVSPDSRTVDLLDRLSEEKVFEKVFPLTANSIWPGSGTVLLRWIKEEEPDVYGKTRHVCMFKDYIKYRLTGELTTDHTDFSSANLLSTWEYRVAPEIFDYFGVPEVTNMVPPVLDSWVLAGKVNQEGARRTGLKEGTPVAEGGVDYNMVSLGAGCVEPRQLCFVVGTWSMNTLLIDHPVHAPNLLLSQTYVVPKLWQLVDASPSSATNMDWFVEQFCHGERAEAKQRGVSPFEIVNEEIKDMRPESCNIIFHPFLFGSNVQPTARAGFYGLAGWNTRADLLRSVMEGVCFGHRAHIDKLTAVETVEEAFIGGGGKRSRVWTQMFADVLNKRVVVPASNELGALGCAVTSAVAVGIYPDHKTATRKMCSVERIEQPNPEAHAIYNKKYALYKLLTETMVSAWNTMYREIQTIRN